MMYLGDIGFWCARILLYLFTPIAVILGLATFFAGGYFGIASWFFMIHLVHEWHRGWHRVMEARIGGDAKKGFKATSDWMLGAAATTNPQPRYRPLYDRHNDLGANNDQAPLVPRQETEHATCPTCSARHLAPIPYRCPHCNTRLTGGFERMRP